MDDGFIVPRQRRGIQQVRPNDIQDFPIQTRQNSFQVLLEEEGMKRGSLTFLPMDRIIAWNVRGLNNPNEQEGIRCFLQSQGAGLVGLVETKVKHENMDEVANRLFRGWAVSYTHLTLPTKRIV